MHLGVRKNKNLELYGMYVVILGSSTPPEYF